MFDESTPSVLRTVVASAVLVVLVVGWHWPTSAAVVLAVVLVGSEARRGTIEHGLRVASVMFVPTLVAMERYNVQAGTTGRTARPVAAELGLWGLILAIGAFVPRPTPMGPPSRRVTFSNSEGVEQRSPDGEGGTDSRSAEVVKFGRAREASPEAA